MPSHTLAGEFETKGSYSPVLLPSPPSQGCRATALVSSGLAQQHTEHFSTPNPCRYISHYLRGYIVKVWQIMQIHDVEALLQNCGVDEGLKRASL